MIMFDVFGQTERISSIFQFIFNSIVISFMGRDYGVYV